MQISIRDIGTSKGIIIPAAMLKEYGMVDVLEVEQSEEGIILKAVSKKRQGWEEDAKRIAAADENSLIPDIFADEDLSWWEWEDKK